MILTLSIKEKNIVLSLLDDDEAIDNVSWTDDNNLSEKLLPTLDHMLKKNKLSTDDIEDFTLDTDVPMGYTTVRIARTIIKSFTFATKMNKMNKKE